MYDDNDQTSSSEPVQIPGAHILGSDILHPFDFVAQSEDVFPTPHAGGGNPARRPAAHSQRPFLTRLVRALGMALLFIACLAFPFLIPFVYMVRRSGRR